MGTARGRALSSAAQWAAFLLLFVGATSSRRCPRTAESFSTVSSTDSRAKRGVASSPERRRYFYWSVPRQKRDRCAPRSAAVTATALAENATIWFDAGQARPLQPRPKRGRNRTNDLLSFARSLQRARLPSSNNNDNRTEAGSTDKTKHKSRAAYSLVAYLSTNALGGDPPDDAYKADELRMLEDALERAVVQGVRLGAGENDYRLIVQLVDATLQFANAHAVVRPRIVGEAVDGLATTSASAGKIQKLWKLLGSGSMAAAAPVLRPAYLTSPPGPLETNAMLKALMSRGKVGAALELFHDSHQTGSLTARRPASRTDAYSVSVVLEGLAQSISTSEDSTKPSRNATATHARPIISLKRFRSWATSPCWQWNEAVAALDLAIISAPNPKDGQLARNNHVVAALLKLNVRAGEAFRRHDAVQFALEILDWMEECAKSSESTSSSNVDAVTCSLLLTGLRSRWRVAVSLLRRMRHSSSEVPPPPGTISFAPPNEYCYSAAVAACARSRQYEEAIALLEELDQDPNCSASTPVYNSVLQSLVTTRHNRHEGLLGAPSRSSKRMRQEARRRWELAMHVFHKIHPSKEADHVPRADSITYNTLLMILAGTVHVLGTSDWDLLAFPTSRAVGSALRDNKGWVEELPRILLEEMRDNDLPREDATYRRAFSACTSLPGLAHLVDAAMSDHEARVSHDALHSALPIAAHLGGFEGLRQLLQVVPLPIESESLPHVTLALAICQKTTLIPVVTRAIFNDSSAMHRLEQQLGRQVFASRSQHIRDEDVSRPLEVAVQTCLRARDLDSASLVMRQLKDGDRTRRLSPVVFQEVGRMYALQGLRRFSSRKEDPGCVIGQENSHKAYIVLLSVQDPPLSLMSLVAKSLSHNGLFDEARDVLERIHDVASQPPSNDDSRTAGQLQQVHKALLSSCADRGNITAALGLCECIQKSAISRPYQGHATYAPSCFELSASMNVAEWRLLLVAALKSGHWRVCLSTLQFLQPFVEALRPEILADRSEASTHNRKYRDLSSALNLAVKCLALRGQYGWIVRVLNDWVAWSGRRPPKQSVFLAIRALCVRGRGIEVENLLAKCVAPLPMDASREGPTYEIALAVFAITSLYNEGLYDAADDVFISSVRSKTLPLNMQEKSILNTNKRIITLDLHGMNLAVAHSAVRIALQQVARDSMTRQPEGLVTSESDLVIVTGRGRTSALRMRPVLRPEVQRMLVEEFYPPLGSSSIPGNMGALRVPGEDVQTWLDNQRVAKRSRVMAVAALLKKISSDAMRAAVTISSSGTTGATSPEE